MTLKYYERAEFLRLVSRRYNSWEALFHHLSLDRSACNGFAARKNELGCSGNSGRKFGTKPI
jgi:hypothetical protein